MEVRRILLCIFLMAFVTYVPRVLPLTFFRRQIKSRYLKSFLDYTPYAVLGAMTFPDVFTSTGNLLTALAGTGTALFLSYRKKGLVTVACGAIVVVYLLELLI